MRIFASISGTVLCLVVFLLSPAAPLSAQERITDFDSRIYVDRSGDLTVTETITAIAQGDRIKRGIYREFPTNYRNRAGARVRVGFQILEVTRDGRAEPYHTEQAGNGVRLYIGDTDVFLDPGSYTYAITYQTDRQIGFFADYDELYWNVTGNDWEFPIDTAAATIILPEGATILQTSTYTGRMGSTASNAQITEQTDHSITFRTTAPLGPGEGLTVAVAWPKGIVPEPTRQEETSYFLRDNLTLLAGSAGLCILFFYYLAVWSRVGKDPEPGTIIPRFEPPEGFTPAAARYVMKMGFDDKTFTAALVNMAVKKYLIIDDDGKTFTLSKAIKANPDVLTRGEKKTAHALFAGRDLVELKQQNHRTIREAMQALEKTLETDFAALHFKLNTKYMIPGLLLTLLVIGAIILTADQREIAGFMSIWLSLWSMGCATLLYSLYKAWKAALSGRAKITDKGGALFLSIFSLPFLGGWLLGFVVMAGAISLVNIIVLLVLLAVNIVFFLLLRAPTIHGRNVMDQLEGLKLYLSVAEKDRLNILNPPEKTPALFERFLPWALALDVEQQWTEQFSSVFAQMAQEGRYEPTWYNSRRPFSSRALASSLGSSLASAVSSSSTAPGSRSGSRGGGSSGGGGGGGGGGGW
ncbi:MAG: DUF2207 domain-containing protein [Desulfobulbaceae bacterium]|jgi:uncharacterized membrane protein YgcG|nr:DUF2207 domain-containing protein [Desulfobulbaceae bacterium]